MSGLSRAVTWTQRVGYSYPPRYIQAALKDRFPRLTEKEVIHCVLEHERVHGDWMRRCEGHEAFRRPTEARP